MGRSLALSQITDSPQYRQGLPAVLAVDYVPFFDPAKERASTEAAVRTRCVNTSPATRANTRSCAWRWCRVRAVTTPATTIFSRR